MDYVTIKWLHILSSTLLFGTGTGSAFLMFVANRSRDLPRIHFAVRHVVKADWVFTAPSAVFQLSSGLALARLGGFPVTAAWIAGSIGLYVIAALCWLPVVWLQIKMRDMAVAAVANGTGLPGLYWVYDRVWITLGCIAFPAVAAIFWLMVAKPGS